MTAIEQNNNNFCFAVVTVTKAKDRVRLFLRISRRPYKTLRRPLSTLRSFNTSLQRQFHSHTLNC